jgi:DNA-binding transcriptional LysR family regulator
MPPMEPPLDWTWLRTLLSVVREGSFGRAARALGTSQPSVGRHVKQLEAALEARLFERRGQLLVPSALAQQLAEQAAGMQACAERVGELAAAHRAAQSGSVRISASRMTATHLLPPLLARLDQGRGAPVIELVPEDALSNLSQREVDLAVRLVRPARTSARVRRAGSIAVGLYAARSYVARRGLPAARAQLAEHSIVGFDQSAMMGRGARRLGLPGDARAFAFKVDDRVVQWSAIRAGVGIGVLPVYLAAGDPELVRVLPELALPPTGVWLVALPDVLARPPVRQVFDALSAGISARLAAAL